MRNVYKLVLFFLLLTPVAFGQQIKGYIYDASNKEPLAGVNVYYKDKGSMKGTISDQNGAYELDLQKGYLSLTYSYLGYETQTVAISAESGKTYTQNINMDVQSNLMDEVVVSAGRYEQKLSDITVSMELLKAADIGRQAPTDLTSVLTTLPGVDVTDRQPSIRGGSGWTYGVGSRCMILVDGMSVLSPGSNEINWNIVPVEQIEQVEVLKGASSVLYGSSAINGLINVRTKRPGVKPVTNISAYTGIYGNPSNSSYKWWEKDYWKNHSYPSKPFLRKNLFSKVDNPIYNGIDISHSRRIGNVDISAGLNAFSDESYREGNYTERFRIGGNLTYHDPRVQGLNYGINANYLSNDYAGFFLWRSPEEAYQQSPLANMGRQGTSFYIDPFLNYTNSEKGTTHRFKSRIYRRADRIISNTTDKSIFDIADNMGFDYNSIPDIISMGQNWKTELLPRFMPYLGQIMSGNLTGAANEVGKLGNQFFPNAKPADYMDLISWVMGRTPIPTNKDEIVPWLTDALGNPKKELVEPDRIMSYFLDYQYSKQFAHSQLSAGGTYERVHVDSKVTGTHVSDNAAMYLQYDHKLFDRLNISAGMRLEYYRVDDHYKEAETKILGVKMPFKPVFRGGLNYQLADYSFIRASFGQGYRYPSIIEKFVLKDIGGVGAFPNANLKAEQGFNAELGIKQGYKLGNLKGFLDVAGFYTQYKDMIEFQIGLFNSQTFDYVTNLMDVISMITDGQMPGIGAQFTNVGKARIYGVDISTSGMYDFNPDTKLTYNLGYVYTEPIDVDADERNKAEEKNKDLLAMKSKSNNSKYLKYRQKHSVKGVFDLEWKRWNLGTNLTWKSKTLAVDYFLVDERVGKPHDKDLMDYVRGLMFGDLHNYWMDNNTGYFAMDLRVGMKITKNLRFQGMINNLLNTEYSIRPMDVSAPRTFVLQLNANF